MKVSVITTAYNHQDTIQRAIDSVNAQLGVTFEHIVIDDTVTKNGMMKTYQNAFNRCQGEYIAFCDGDDYWIASHKLFSQYKYMEEHPECGLCITKVYTLKNGELFGMPDANYVNANMTFDSLLKGSAHINAQSYFLRKGVIDFNKIVNLGFKLWDYPIVLELIQNSRIHCLDFYSAVNVINEESVTHTNSRIKRIKYLYEQFKIKWYYIKKYCCKTSTRIYLIYRVIRHLYSIGFKRWNK